MPAIHGLFEPELRWDWTAVPTNNSDFLHTLSFPLGFKWGVADSAYQTEGSAYSGGKQCQNNWTAFEQARNAQGNSYIANGDCAGSACDRWNKMQEDVALIKASGFTIYRFSIEWSKLEPQEGVFDSDVMQHYIDFVDELRKNDIEPVIMLFHHAWPLWFDAKGAFERAENIADFVEFSEYIFEKLHEKVKIWMTINEPTGYAFEGYFRGNYPPCKKSLPLAGRVLRNFLDAHIAVYNAFKKHDHSVEVGYAKIVQPLDPYNPWNPIERLIAGIFDNLMNDVDLYYFKTGIFNWSVPGQSLVYSTNPEAVGALDFIGVNYYSHTSIKMHYRLHNIIAPAIHPHEKITSYGQAIYPEGLYRSIQKCATLQKPMYVAENGVADNTDELKQLFIKQHLHAVSKACTDGYDVRGYFYWTLLDNFEWCKGYTQKFGLYAVDRTTQERTLKPGSKSFITFVQSQNT